MKLRKRPGSVADRTEEEVKLILVVLDAADELVDEIGKGGPKGNYDARAVTEKLRVLVRAVLVRRKAQR